MPAGANNHAERRGAAFALFAAVTVIALFMVAAFLVRGAIDRNTFFQRELRMAQTDRSRLLLQQVDEETGIRGYVATRARVFLQPYRAGLLAFPQTARRLDQSLKALAVNDDDVRAEVALNREWLAQIARPTIANPALGDAVAYQLRGKAIVDAMRSKDAALDDAINAAADAAEARTSRLVSDILTFSIAAGALISLALLWLSYVQYRLAADLEEQHRAYIEEKRVADALQEAFVQKNLPELAKADLHGVYTPAGLEAKVGGDWYDAFELSEGRILFSIGDVAGHGIEAAVVMSRVRQAVLSIGMEERDPGKVLGRANDILLLQDSTMVTAACGMIDLAHGVIRIASAGHPPAILLRPSGDVQMFGASGPPLGALDHPSYETYSAFVEPGSMLVLYTDGLIEYGRDWEAGEARLLEAISSVDRSATSDPAASIVKAIFEDKPPVDDVAILTITFRDSRTERKPIAAAVASPVARPLLDPSKLLLVKRLEASAPEVEWLQYGS